MLAAMEVVLVLLAAGVILLFLETVLPGLVAGIAGFCCLVAGVVMAYVRFGAHTGNLVLFLVLAGLVVGFAVWVKYFPESRFARVFISQRISGDLGTEQPQLVGQTGMAHTQLRPSGTAVISGRRVDVVSEGALISRGTPVKVIAVEGLRVVVRELTEEELAARAPRPPTQS